MQTELIVKGVHCDACLALIKMELEDIGLLDNLLELKLDSDGNTGTLRLDARETELAIFVEAINALDG